MNRLLNSFSYAVQGVAYAAVQGHNMRIHLLAAMAAVGLGFAADLTGTEWALLSLTIFMVLAAETINTAIEKTVDLIGTERHPLAKTAKDLAAGGVLLTAVNAVIIAFILFGPYLLSIFRHY